MNWDATPPERVQHAQGPGDRPVAGEGVLTRRPEARRSCRVQGQGRAQKRGLCGTGKGSKI